MTDSTRCTTVLYDASCPLCRREIALYQSLPSEAPIRWVDVSGPDVPLPCDLPREHLMRRFHLISADDRVLSGAAAFVHLWRQLPGWRHLARLAVIPGFVALMEVMYRFFLLVRPAVQRLVRAWDVSHLPRELVADLRSDQAGETGAVWIYRAILWVTRDPQLRTFATHHLETEQRHLEAINRLLPPARRSWLLVPWRIAGFMTGLTPALFGPRAVYATIAAVETFVDQHYQHQIDTLARLGTHPELKHALESFQRDERDHRDDASGRLDAPAGALVGAWCALVGAGSKFAVRIARIV